MAEKSFLENEEKKKPLGHVVFEDGTTRFYCSLEELAEINREARENKNPVVSVEKNE